VFGPKEQKAAFIKEDEVAPKSLEFFLALAICGASSARWLFHHAAMLGAQEPGNSIRNAEELSKHGWDDTILQIPCASLSQCA
jgi:hypothetical protein